MSDRRLRTKTEDMSRRWGRRGKNAVNMRRKEVGSRGNEGARSAAPAGCSELRKKQRKADVKGGKQKRKRK